MPERARSRKVFAGVFYREKRFSEQIERMLQSHIQHECCESEVRIIGAACLSCGLPNRSHTRINKMLVSFRFRSSQKGALHNNANFGIGTLAAHEVDFRDLSFRVK